MISFKDEQLKHYNCSDCSLSLSQNTNLVSDFKFICHLNFIFSSNIALSMYRLDSPTMITPLIFSTIRLLNICFLEFLSIPTVRPHFQILEILYTRYIRSAM